MFTADAHCDALYRMAMGGSPRSVTPETLRQGNVGVQALAMFAGEDGDAVSTARRQWPPPCMPLACLC